MNQDKHKQMKNVKNVKLIINSFVNKKVYFIILLWWCTYMSKM